MGADDGVLSEFKIPRSPDAGGGVNFAVRTYFGTPKAEDKDSPTVEERQREGADEDGVADVPR